ncbi:MAG: Rpn family recombination-promoting nuclease/putative transposase, partial [Fibrobacter sp.]|nr:Rpn family recombination-promoting nuclease/putative transposase [Fibrobacter sp.]
MRYILEIWDQHEKQNGSGKHLPLVIPIVICHCNKPCKFDNS